MNEQQIESHLQMIITAIKEITQGIQHDQSTGEPLHSLNRKAVELATEIVLEIQKEKRHADNIQLGYDALWSINNTLARIENKLS